MKIASFLVMSLGAALLVTATGCAGESDEPNDGNDAKVESPAPTDGESDEGIETGKTSSALCSAKRVTTTGTTTGGSVYATQLHALLTLQARCAFTYSASMRNFNFSYAYGYYYASADCTCY